MPASLAGERVEPVDPVLELVAGEQVVADGTVLDDVPGHHRVRVAGRGEHTVSGLSGEGGVADPAEGVVDRLLHPLGRCPRFHRATPPRTCTHLPRTWSRPPKWAVSSFVENTPSLSTSGSAVVLARNGAHGALREFPSRSDHRRRGVRLFSGRPHHCNRGDFGAHARTHARRSALHAARPQPASCAAVSSGTNAPHTYTLCFRGGFDAHSGNSLESRFGAEDSRPA